MTFIAIISFVFILLGALCESVSLTKKVEPVDTVTIYGSNIAQVKRGIIFKEPLTPGTHSVIVDGFSSSLYDRSVEIFGLQDKVEILDIKVFDVETPRYSNVNYQAQLKTLREKLEELKYQNETLSRQLELQELKSSSIQDFVQRVLNASSSAVFAATNDVLELLAVQENQLKKINEDILAVHKQHHTLLKDISAVEVTIQRLQNTGQLIDKEANILQEFNTKREKRVAFQMRVTAATTEPSTLWISYFALQSAGWEAEYDVRVGRALTTTTTTASKPSASYGQYSIEVDYFASVWQQSGDSWDEVSLMVSTARPASAPPAPEPRSLGVYFENTNFGSFGKAASSSVGGMSTTAMSSVQSGSVALMSEAAPMRPQYAKAVKAESFDSVSGGDVAMFRMASPEAMSLTGDTGAAVLFQIPYRVNITDINVASVSKSVPRPRHRLLIDRVLFPATLFTFAVPSLGAMPVLRLLGNLQTGAEGTTTSLIASNNARVFMEDAYSGTTDFGAVKSGGEVRLVLGEQRNVEVTSTVAVPLSDRKVEDKSTWFVTDKEKFRMKTEEILFTARNTYPARRGAVDVDALVVLAEALPRASDADIAVTLLTPTSAQLQSSLDKATQLLKDVGARGTSSSSSTAGAGDKDASAVNNAKRAQGYLDNIVNPKGAQGEEFLSAILQVATLARTKSAAADTGASSSSSSSDDSLLVFRNAATGHVYWLKWLAPGQAFSSTYKYRITWPDARPSIVVV